MKSETETRGDGQEPGASGPAETRVFQQSVRRFLAATAPEASRLADGDSLGRSPGEGRSDWSVEVVERTGSTNTDLMARVHQGDCPPRTALIALEQVRGKGRLDRTWSAPPGTSLFLSMALPMASQPSWWGLMPLAAGLAVAGALKAVAGGGQTAGGPITLKWPNDVRIGQKKVCGILVEAVAGTAVVGAGINVSQAEAELGFPTATSLALAGVRVSREELAAAVLVRTAAVWRLFDRPDGAESLLTAYRSDCDTLGRPVRLQLTESSWVEGEAVDLAGDGQLVVRVDGRLRQFASGDVFHLR